MHMHARVLLAVAVAALALAADAGAAGWSPAQTIGPAAPNVANPFLAIGANGQALLGGDYSSPTPPFPPAGTRVFARAADGTVAESPDSPAALAAPPARYAQQRAIVLQRDPVNTTKPYRLSYAFASTDGSIGTTHRLTNAAAFYLSPTVAANARGDAVIAWVTPDKTGQHGAVWVAIRRAGGRFGAPTRVVDGAGVDTVAVAVSGKGDLVVAFTRSRYATVSGHRRLQRKVQARWRDAGHSSFSAVQTLGDERGYALLSAAASPTSGRMAVTWGTQDAGEEANEPWRVYAAMRGAGTRAFRATQTLEAGGAVERPSSGPKLAFDGSGGATVAWTSIVKPTSTTLAYPVRAAISGSDLRFGTPEQLADTGADLDLAVEGDGAAVLAWAHTTEDYQLTDQILAATRAAGAASFAAAEAVSPVEDAAQPAVGLDPRTGAPVVVWAAAVAPQPTPDSPPSDRVLRIATR
jgi:hypothetical protein